MTAARTLEPDRGGPFLTSSVLGEGVSKRELRGSTWQQVFWGVHVPANVELDVGLRARAALLLHPVPDAHLSHATVAQLRRIPVPPDDQIHVTVHNRTDRRYRVGLQPHYRAASSDCVRLQGMPASSSLQLFVELASTLSFVDTVVAGDHMVKHGFFSVEELVSHCQQLRGKHVRKSRRAASFVRDGVDSPMETRLRLLLVLAGLPEPIVNYCIRNAAGRVVRRFDLSYPGLRLVVEYDGRPHIERVEQWQADIDRREELEGQGWRIIVITGHGIMVNPERTLERVGAALAVRGRQAASAQRRLEGSLPAEVIVANRALARWGRHSGHTARNSPASARFERTHTQTRAYRPWLATAAAASAAAEGSR